MKVVTIGRKPFQGGTTVNVVEHGCGAFNIDKTRLGSRWPANVLFLHLPGCKKGGTKTAKGYIINRFVDGAKPFGGGAGHEFETEVLPDQIVDVWECGEGCPVTVLREEETHFFKQIARTDMDIPEDLWTEMYNLIAPPEGREPVIIAEDSLKGIDFSLFEDESVHGLITVGDPTPYLEDIDRVLKPGGHILLISPEEDPTGCDGACAIDEFGYEMRDAMLILDTPEGFHYVAKPSPKERHAGVIEHKDELTGRFVQNSHVTVKPVGVMRALLQDVPTEQGPVVDPFMGSGTTGIACIHTKHNFIGIEQDADYLVIAHHRVHHWDRAFCAWDGVDIESEAVIEEDKPMSLEDLFGF